LGEANDVSTANDLARRMAGLEEDAFCEFADEFGPRLKAFFLRERLNVSDAEDLAAQCVGDIALKVGRFDPDKGGNFSGWAYALARNALVDWLRRRRPETFLEDLPEAQWAQLERAEPNMEVVSAVNEALGKLSENDRTIIELRDYGIEYSYAEIGQRLGIETGTARLRRFRALRRLEGILEQDARILKVLGRNQKRAMSKNE